MRYLDISLEEARKCCKRFNRKCEKCPLRVERTEINPYTNKPIVFLQFCRYVLAEVETTEEQKEEILDMQPQHEDEWEKYIKAVESEP